MQAEMRTQLYRKKLSSRAPSKGTEPRGRGCTCAWIHLICLTAGDPSPTACSTDCQKAIYWLLHVRQ